MNTPALDEDFLEFESKVNQVMKLLDDITNANKKEGEESSTKKPVKNILDEINENDFIITVKEDRTVLNKRPTAKTDEDAKKESEDGTATTAEVDDVNEMNKFTFMKQLEQDAEERAKNKKERERIAQNFRTLGNDAYRKQNLEKAINLYTKAIDHVKDSPILYNNRSLCYIKLKNFKRAIMDSDYVLNKLEEKNIRSWLYRAAAYKRLGDEKNYETSIKLARKNNPKKTEFIDNFLDRLMRESI